MLRNVCSVPMLAFVLTGCGWTITPPEEVNEPADVYVTSYGWHTRLALPDAGNRRLIEYGFGDWQYYALQRQSVWSGLRALFFSEASALSRRELPWPENVTTSALPGGAYTVRITVERARAQALKQSLEAQWEALESEKVINEAEKLELARTDEPYHLSKNSNAQTAEWLRELGCEITGTPIRSDFRVVTPSPFREEGRRE